MKFLKEAMPGDQLMIIRTYYDPGSKDYNVPDDILDIVYKNVESGKIHVESIKHPKIEVFIEKPEYRNHEHYPNYLEKSHCDSYWVPYKNRFEKISKILGGNAKNAKYSNIVGQIDMDIQHFYLMMFYKEYGQYCENRPITTAFSDIETDIIQIDHFPSPGEAPINAISYFDEHEHVMYTFVCTQDNVPVVMKGDKKYEYYEKLRKRFREQTDYFIDHQKEFKEECKKLFEPSYGKAEYKILIFDEEIKMLKAYWELVERVEASFVFFWNAPFDISNLVERIRTLGYDPNEFIPTPKLRGTRNVRWYEDKNHQAHKRKHIFDLYTKSIFSDQMVNYAGIRSGKGKLESVKLNVIAKKELEDEKLDYTEYGNIRMFPYHDFWKFILYNIKDVWLQVGIDRMVKDSEYIYLLMSTTCIKPNEAFTTTTFDCNDLRLFVDMHYDVVLGQNKNKLFKTYKSEDDLDDEDNEEDKFSGAFVMSPNHCKSTGFILLGALNNFIHDHCIDMDIGSEYPTAFLISNACNDTMLGKVFLINPEGIEIKRYDNMYTVDKKDEICYQKTSDPSNLMMEALTEDNPTAFGETYFKLPSFTTIADHIEEHFDLFID